MEEFYPLSIKVQTKNNVTEGLENFIEGEIIGDFTCENCQQKVDVIKKTVIKKLPNTLIIHLNRIVFDMEMMDNVKVNEKYEFQ